MEAWNRVQGPPGGNAEGKTLIHEGHEGTRGLGYQVRGGCAAFQMHPGRQPEVCPPWQGGPQGVCYELPKTPCREIRGEAFSKLRFP
jgi:hypothetical protein